MDSYTTMLLFPEALAIVKNFASRNSVVNEWMHGLIQFANAFCVVFATCQPLYIELAQLYYLMYIIWSITPLARGDYNSQSHKLKSGQLAG